jgi:hypothetical protein
MLTIKDVKEFRGLDQKARIKAAETIGRNASEATVYGKLTGLALASGMDAKANGEKGYSFERAFDAFATEYFAGASEGTVKAYRSAVNAWSRAGMHAAWDATEIAVRVFNEKGQSLTARGGMLSRLLKLEKEPTAKEYAKARPTSGNTAGGSTLKGAAASTYRSVAGFGIKWADKLPADLRASYAEIRAAMDKFAKMVAELDGDKPAKPKAKGAKPTFKELDAELSKKLAALTSKSGGGTKTLQ